MSMYFNTNQSIMITIVFNKDRGAIDKADTDVDIPHGIIRWRSADVFTINVSNDVLSIINKSDHWKEVCHEIVKYVNTNWNKIEDIISLDDIPSTRDRN